MVRAVLMAVFLRMWRCRAAIYLPLKGGGIGGLRPPFLAQRTPMPCIGYVAKRSGWGSTAHMIRSNATPTRPPSLRLAVDLSLSGGGIPSQPPSSSSLALQWLAVSFVQRPQDRFRLERQFGQANAAGIGDCVG